MKNRYRFISEVDIAPPPPPPPPPPPSYFWTKAEAHMAEAASTPVARDHFLEDI